MRVGFLLEQCLAPVPGGTGRYSRELARALAAGAPDGCAVAGFTAWHRDVTGAAVPGVAGPRRVPLPRRALALSWERGVGPVPHGVDLVHAPTLLAPPRRGRPLVVNVHDTVPWTHPETLTQRGVRFHRRIAERVARAADVVITLTRAVADELGAVLSLDAARLRVVPPGVTPWPIEPDGGARRRETLGVSGRYVVCLGSLEPRKGLDTALRALARADADGLTLAVVGPPGWGGVDLPREALRAGLPAARLAVLGPLPDADVAAVLAGALALLQPSRAEGFGLPVVEAQALGVPVVITDVAALREVAGEAALVVAVDDDLALAEAVGRLAGDPALREEMARAGRANAARFTWESAAAATWAAYEHAVRRSATKGD